MYSNIEGLNLSGKDSGSNPFGRTQVSLYVCVCVYIRALSQLVVASIQYVIILPNSPICEVTCINDEFSWVSMYTTITMSNQLSFKTQIIKLYFISLRCITFIKLLQNLSCSTD